MKKYTIIPLMLFMVFALIGMASATITIVTPASSAVVSGTYVFNVSSTNDFAAQTMANCTITGSSALTGDTETIYVYNDTTMAGGLNYSNSSKNTKVMIDGSDWTFTAVCTNGTTTATSAAVTSVIIDNTVPVCSQSTLVSDTTYNILKKSKTLTVTGTNATSASAVFGSTTFTLTESADTFTVNIGTLASQIYNPTITTSDGRNTTTCTAVTDINVRQEQKNVGLEITGPVAAQVIGAKDMKKPIIIMILGCVALFLVFIVFSKKRR